MKDTAFIHALEMLTEGASASCAQLYEQTTPALLTEHERRHRALIRGRNIAGLGVGEKEAGGNLTDELSLRFYVRRKLPKSKCRIMIPARIDTPGLGPVRTDVIEIGELRPHVSRKAKQRPAHPGCSVGSGLIAGTLGCIVKKRNGSPGSYLLTNAHVIARDGIAALSSPVFQPAQVDERSAPAGSFAELSEVVPFEFSPSKYNNLVDAAIARIRRPSTAASMIIGIGAPAGVVAAARGMLVQKSGRSSDLTHGKVRDIHFRTHLQYERDTMGNIGWVGFKDQILVTRFSQEGDSGALVLNQENMAVGLLFAGSEQVSICNSIQNVFELLDLEFA